MLLKDNNKIKYTIFISIIKTATMIIALKIIIIKHFRINKAKVKF